LKVYIVPGMHHDPAEMFANHGWDVVSISDSPDLVVFTGGEDIDPSIYGEVNTQSWSNPSRDRREIDVFNRFIGNTPMAGICRGGQLLNALNGGKLIQHVGHHSGDKPVVTHWGVEDGSTHHSFRVCHHQGIVRNPNKESYGNTHPMSIAREFRHIDYSLYYPDSRCYCFQPHPEWGHDGTENFWFWALNEYLGMRGRTSDIREIGVAA
jgi:GMP synthase-like glutamine amidotransferase